MTRGLSAVARRDTYRPCSCQTISPASTLGTLGYAAQGASQSGISTSVDVNGCSVTATTGSGRRIKVTAQLELAGTVANDDFAMLIFED